MFRYNLELALRSFLRDKLLTALMVLMIALGIGASMTTSTVYYVLSGDPVPGRSDTLFYPQLDPADMQSYFPGAEPGDRMTRFDAEALLRERRGDRQAVMSGGRVVVTQQREGMAWYSVIQARYTSGDFFAMFQTPFLYGGPWSRAEDDQRSRVIVIAKSLNDRLFGGANSVGKPLRLTRLGDAFSIAGVLDDWRPPAKFFDLGRDTYGEREQVFMPFSTSRELDLAVNSEFSCWGTADERGKDPQGELGVNAPCAWLQYWVQLDTPAKHDAYLRYLTNYSDQQRAAGRYQRPTNVRLRSLMQWLDRKQAALADARLQMWLAFGLLLVCQLNAMGLLLVKLLHRSVEIGVRRALGASRRAIFAQVLTEAGVVGLVGGVLGLGFVLLGLWVVRQRPAGYAELVHLDPLMLITTIVLAITSTMVAGLLPAWRACRIAPGLQMKSQGWEPSRGRAAAATGPVHWLRRRVFNAPQAGGSQPARCVPDSRESKKSENQARPWTPAVAWFQMLLFRMGFTEVRPILSALRRHKTVVTLIVLEIALSCAILCNAMFLIVGRIERLQRPSGLAEQEIVRVQVGSIGDQVNPEALTREDLAALRALPGVRAATSTNAVIFGRTDADVPVKLAAEQTQPTLQVASAYMGDEQLLETLGVNLVAGRHFKPDEYGKWDYFTGLGEIPPAVIITRAMADKLFPGQNPLGKSLYVGSVFDISGNQPSRVVGIVERLVQVRDPSGIDPAAYEYSMLFPAHVTYTVNGYYLLRVKDPAQRAQVLQAATDVLRRSGPNRRVILDQDTFEEMRDEYYGQDRDMVWLLGFVCVTLLVATAASIVGLSSFWVRQRTRQIGVRRALGATRGQILRYFQTENFLLTTLGIVLGMGLAYGLNSLLMVYYELPRLPLIYLPIGAVTLWLLGQLAVLGPAWRAAAVSPAAATRIG